MAVAVPGYPNEFFVGMLSSPSLVRNNVSRVVLQNFLVGVLRC